MENIENFDLRFFSENGQTWDQTKIYFINWKWITTGDCGTVASVVIQAIGSGTNEETLMKATHPMIWLGQFGTCTKLV